MEWEKNLVHIKLKALAINEKDLIMYFPTYFDSKQIQCKAKQYKINSRKSWRSFNEEFIEIFGKKITNKEVYSSAKI